MNKFFTLLMAFMAVTAVYGREISGKVVGENAAPLDYVNVVLYRDSTYIYNWYCHRPSRYVLYPYRCRRKSHRKMFFCRT